VAGSTVNLIAYFILAAASTAALAWLLIPVLSRVGLIDMPGDRKLHSEQTPLTGGPAIGIVLFGLVVWKIPGDPFINGLMLGGGLMLLVGMLDDARGLSPLLRFILQAVACLVVISQGGIYLTDFGSLFWNSELTLGKLAIPITIFSALGVINAFNMIDGMDGLSGMVFLVAAAGLTGLAILAGDNHVAAFLIVAMGAVSGFMMLNARLPWNSKARVFLGDAGSLLLGFILAWCFIREGTGEGRAFAPITAVWLIAVPLLDTSTLIKKRWREGKSALAADQYHLHHACMRIGYSVGQTWWVITGMAVFFALIGILTELINVPDYASFYLFIVMAFAYYFYMKQAWLNQRFLGRDFIYQDFIVEEGWASQEKK
jgi:UDP-GlcNAc:undecaprenyl-phosphate GlcNAc-1-phosphate transferase